MSSGFLVKRHKMSKICEKLLEIRLKSGMSQQKFAEMLGIPQTTWSCYESGKTEPKMKVLMALVNKGYLREYVNTYTNELEIFDTPKQNIPIFSNAEIPEGAFVVPLLDQKLSAGFGQELPETDTIRGLLPAPGYLSAFGKNLAALTVEGDSMYPTLERGDLVICDSSGWSGEGIYALRMSGEGFVKRVTKAPGKVVLISDNPKYPVREEPDDSEDIDLIGRVRCAIKKIE
jgi:transcriptional regulator with XRE-family HTH domain